MVRVGQARYLFRLGIGSKSPTQSNLYIVCFLRTLTLWKVFKPYVRRILLSQFVVQFSHPEWSSISSETKGTPLPLFGFSFARVAFF